MNKYYHNNENFKLPKKTGGLTKDTVIGVRWTREQLTKIEHFTKYSKINTLQSIFI